MARRAGSRPEARRGSALGRGGRCRWRWRSTGFALFKQELLPSFREGHFVLGVAGPPGTSLSGDARLRPADHPRPPGHRRCADAPSSRWAGREGGEDAFGTEKYASSTSSCGPSSPASGRTRSRPDIQKVLEGYPGLQTEVLTFLGDRIGESISGETAALSVGVYGADADTLEAVAADVARTLKSVSGAADVAVQTPPSAPVVRVDLDFGALARFSISPSEALEAVQTTYQGSSVSQLYSGDRATDVAVIASPELRQDPEAVGELLVRGANGVLVPLREVANVYLADGRTMISHEGGRLRQVVTANPKPADAARVTRAARAEIGLRVKLPPGVYLDFTGTAEGAAAARRELLFNTGVALAGVVALLLLAFRSGRDTMLILGSTPFALVGGVIAVALTGGSLSLGSLVGFVTLFGVAARNAILLVSHLEHLITVEARDWSAETVLLATRERVTPILMTALVTGLGVAPLAFASGQAGREIQGPMAIVILGGLVTSTLASLILLPALAWRFGGPPGEKPT